MKAVHGNALTFGSFTNNNIELKCTSSEKHHFKIPHTYGKWERNVLFLSTLLFKELNEKKKKIENLIKAGFSLFMFYNASREKL